MTSVIRSVSQVKEALTRFIKPESPCYNDGTLVRLFPFTYSNGTLDITYDGNTFEAQMVTNTNVDPSSETRTAVRVTSGPYLVNRLGDKFKAYIRAWRDGTIDAGSPIEIYVAPQVFRVQEADTTNIDAIDGNVYKISTDAPAGENYIAGSTANDYRKTCVFKTPLTFTIVESGVTQYITFRTVLDQE